MFDHSEQRADRARKYFSKSPRFYAEMPYLLEVNDETVRTRENALLTSVEISGIDGLTASDRDIADLGKSFSSILDGLDERFTFYIHRLNRPAEFGLRSIYGDRFESDVDNAWAQYLSANNLREFMLVLTVVRNLRTPLKVPLLRKAAMKLLDRNTKERMAELQEVLSILEGSLPVQTRRLKISDGSLLGFFSAISTGIYEPVYRGQHTLIAEDVSLLSIRFQETVAQLRDGFDRPRYCGVFAIWKNANQTWPGMLDALDSGIDTVVTHSFTPLSTDKVSDMAKRRIRQMQNAEDIAGSIADDLADTYDAVEAGKMGFGEHQVTISVFGDSLVDLEAKLSRVRSAAEQAKVKLVRVHDMLPATYFATHPGNQDYEAFKPITKTINFADMASFHMANSGTTPENLPWRTPITVFQTVTGAAHRFSFHEPGSPDAEPTIGHTLLLGPSGGGKTATTAFLAAQARRAGARVFMFDKDEGLRMAVAAMGGRYAKIRAGEPTGLNPLLTEHGARGEAWLLEWLSALAERNGNHLTPQQAAALKNAVRQNCAAPDRLRTFHHFTDLLGDVGDKRSLALKIAEWGPKGRYNWVFGEADKPVIDFSSADVTGVDLTEILSLSAERTAVLSYVFRRLELLFEEKRPTLLIIDEASTVFDDDFFAHWLPKWLVTVRKLNVVVVLLTQFPSQIRDSRSGSIIQALPNQLIFPNRKADVPDYAGFSLTDNELDFVLTGRAGQRLALLRSSHASTILDVDLSPLKELLTALGGGDAGARTFGADYLDRPFFWRTQHA